MFVFHTELCENILNSIYNSLDTIHQVICVEVNK